MNDPLPFFSFPFFFFTDPDYENTTSQDKVNCIFNYILCQIIVRIVLFCNQLNLKPNLKNHDNNIILLLHVIVIKIK